MSRRDRSRSPRRGGGGARDRYKILLKNLPYEVNWQKLKDIVKENCGGNQVMFADIIMNRTGKSAGFGSAEFKTKEEMENAVKKLDGFDVNGRNIKVNADVNGEQLVRMCNKQGLDPGRSGMSARGGNDRGGGGGGYGGDRGGYGGGGGGYGGPPAHDRRGPSGPPDRGYGGPPPPSSYGRGGYDDELPHLNGVPINQLPGMERLSPDVLEAIGKGPVGRSIFVRNLAYTVEDQKIREVFGMAGTIQKVELVFDKDGKSRGFGTITFAQPIEALKAIVMFHTQALFDRKMFVKMDRDNNSRGTREKLPDGLSGINRAAADIGSIPSSNGRDRYGSGGGSGGYGAPPPPSGYGSGPPAGGYNDAYAPPSRSGGNGYSGQRDPYPSGGGYGQGGGYGGGQKYAAGGCVVTVERLPPSATTARLRRLFEDAGRVSFVDLQDHGRATIRFETAYDAERAVGRFNGYMIEGHGLFVHITD